MDFIIRSEMKKEKTNQKQKTGELTAEVQKGERGRLDGEGSINGVDFLIKNMKVENYKQKDKNKKERNLGA